MPTITSANAVYTLTVQASDGTDLFGAPQQLRGFSADDIFTTGPLASSETLMGLDGVLSGGFVFVPIVQNISLQADSDSNDIFEQWWEQQQLARDVYIANGVVLLPAIAKEWVLTKGFLTSFPPIPDAARTLRPRRYAITWNQVSPGNT